MSTPTPEIARLGMPLSQLRTLLAERRLQSLLSTPPLGHVGAPQPADWYERVFDALADAHPDKCTKPKLPGGQS